MKKLFTVVGILSLKLTLAQVSPVTLQDCQQKALAHFPLSGQFELLKSSNELKNLSLNTHYLPQVNINGQATYQSDVTKIPIDIPMFDIPEPPKDHYSLTLDVNQMIFDGGVTSGQKQLEAIGLGIENTKVEIDLYALKQRVNAIFFNIVLLRENKSLLLLLREDITQKLKNLEAGIKYGVVLKKDAYVLKAEILKVDQKLSELECNLSAAYASLSELTLEGYGHKSVFELPQPLVDAGFGANQRLENRLFNLSKQQLIASKDLITSKNNPRIIGFGQAGYGKPGLDMLADKFSSYYMVGAKLNWNIWNWNKGKKNKQILDLGHDMVVNQQNSFNKQIQLELIAKFAEITKYKQLIEKDFSIINLRSKITRVSSSQLDKGVITSTEYLTDLNAELQAKLDLQLHKVMLVKSKVDYLTCKGEF